MCLVLALLAAGAARAEAQSPPATSVSPRIFVAPLEVDGRNTRTYWLGEGAAILIGDELQAIGADAVGRELRVAAFDELHLPETASLTRATLIRVAETLNATDVVVGRVSMSDSALTLRVRLLRLDSGAYQPELVEQGTPTELFTLARRLATRLLAAARGRPEPAPSAAQARGPSLEAFELYAKALLDERPDARIRLLKAALAAQPSFVRPHLALWEAYTKAGQHAEALAAAQAVPASSSRSRDARFMAALSLVELKRFDEAFAALSALGHEYASASIHNNLGVIQLRRGATPQTGRAVYYFSKASEADPHDPDVYFNLGYAYWFEKDAQAAVYWLREAVRRDPLDADAHFVLAAGLTQAGATVEAARERELAGRLAARYEDWERRGNAPDNVPRGLERLRTALVPLRDLAFDAAITTAAQRDAKELTTFYLDRGRRFYEQQRNAEAIVELRKALYLSPYEAEAHLLLGRLYLLTGRDEEAVTALRMSLWSREDARARLALAEALLAADRAPAARVEAQRAIALDPSLEGAQALLAKIEQALKK